jgi:hypothetical protein
MVLEAADHKACKRRRRQFHCPCACRSACLLPCICQACSWELLVNASFRPLATAAGWTAAHDAAYAQPPWGAGRCVTGKQLAAAGGLAPAPDSQLKQLALFVLDGIAVACCCVKLAALAAHVVCAEHDLRCQYRFMMSSSGETGQRLLSSMSSALAPEALCFFADMQAAEPLLTATWRWLTAGQLPAESAEDFFIVENPGARQVPYSEHYRRRTPGPLVNVAAPTTPHETCASWKGWEDPSVCSVKCSAVQGRRPRSPTCGRSATVWMKRASRTL